MRIKSISICNFRSYYGFNPFEIGDNLTLLIGSNGDGKTTFFEALEWLFDTAGALPKVDSKFVSKKRASDLVGDESDRVKVSMTYITGGSEKTVEKSFRFSRTLSGEISTSNFEYIIHFQNGVENDYREGDVAMRMFDRDFPSHIRKYSLFKGEQDLNIFNKQEAMSYLVETFSQIRDFDPYLTFMQEATRMSEMATDAAIRADKKNTKEAEKYRELIRSEEKTVGDMDRERKAKASEAVNFQNLLDNIEKNKDASENLKNTNERIESLKEARDDKQRKISENYTYRLLDDMWILMGFQPIAEEFRAKVGELDRARRKMQSAYDQKMGAEKLAKQMQEELLQGHVPLALNIPDENTMREMIDEHFCKVCGRPALENTPEHNYMKMRLNAFLAARDKVEMQEEETPELFGYDFIKELNNLYSVIHNNYSFLGGLDGFIEKTLLNNFRLHQEIDKLSEEIAKAEDDKKKILAQTDGLSEEALISTYHDISTWWNARIDAEKRCKVLGDEIERHKKKLDEYRDAYSKISQESTAAMYSRTSNALRKICEAFGNAKSKNRRDFLDQLESACNEYLVLLNQGDFRGTARILEKADDSAELILVDADGTRIYNPNTALKTTMYMSLLFAVAKLTTLKHDDDFPLIFDAPTSSFTAAKESDFFSVIGGIEKQTIIVTKSFLNEKPGGGIILDESRLASIAGCKYRIKKAEPFNEEDLSTIQTKVTPII